MQANRKILGIKASQIQNNSFSNRIFRVDKFVHLRKRLGTTGGNSGFIHQDLLRKTKHH